NSVLFPHPEGPRSTVVWPGATVSEMSWRIGLAPYAKQTLWTSMIAIMYPQGGARPQPDHDRQGRQRQQHEDQGQGRHHRLWAVRHQGVDAHGQRFIAGRVDRHGGVQVAQTEEERQEPRGYQRLLEGRDVDAEDLSTP